LLSSVYAISAKSGGPFTHAIAEVGRRAVLRARPSRSPTDTPDADVARFLDDAATPQAIAARQRTPPSLRSTRLADAG